MSYILDALKKSEAERSQLHSISLLNYPNNKQIAGIPIWLVISLTLLINISALLLWTFWPYISQWQTGNDTTSDVTVQTSAKTTMEALAPITEAKPEQSTEAEEFATKPLPDTKISAKSKIQTSSQTSPAKPILPFAALSKTDRDLFPDIEFSTHIFAEDPELRTLIANGMRLREGEMLSENTQLITITENGAVFLHAGNMIKIPVLQEWRTQ